MHPGVIITSALAGVFGLAIVAVIVSKNAQTGSVLSSAGTALSEVIKAATEPVTGNVGNSLANSSGSWLTGTQSAGLPF